MVMSCPLPTEDTAKLALRTQQIIAGESGAPNVVDPFGGLYAVEALTSEIEKRARKEIERIDSMGGAVSAIERGYIQKEIHESAFAYQKSIESQEQIIVGVNAYKSGAMPPSRLLRINPQGEARQRSRIAMLRKKRNRVKAQSAIAALKERAEGKANLIPLILDAVKVQVSLGEICNSLRGVWGEHDTMRFPKT